jgi:hypothetical protein
MKTCNMLIIGVLVIAFLVIPVSAVEYMANGGPVEQIGTGTVAPASAEGVVPAGTYSNYFYFFNHGTAANTQTNNGKGYNYPSIASVTDLPWGHGTNLTPAPSQAVCATAWVNLPVTQVASYTGIHPKVRYATIRMFDYAGTAGIKEVDVYNGENEIGAYPVSWHNVGWSDYTLDLGSYYDMVRGMNLLCIEYNVDTATYNWVVIGGYGAKAEW